MPLYGQIFHPYSMGMRPQKSDPKILFQKYLFSDPVGSGGNGSVCGHIMVRFHPSCARLVYFLCKSTEVHVNQTECQRIHFHFLLLIFS